MITPLPKTSRLRGQVMTEYLIATMFLVILVWYAIVGGTTDPKTKKGGWADTELTPGTGTYYDEFHDTAGLEAPGLVQAIHNKQETFASAIYKP
ncbi:hypothetical protein A9Q81_24465 [Gammaproteobacteria bacterium 42_54_T18]|nr:hypothetical protein A9Q81_24465 [Gammaproteobacteria bacterium 42_54_T18]